MELELVKKQREQLDDIFDTHAHVGFSNYLSSVAQTLAAGLLLNESYASLNIWC